MRLAFLKDGVTVPRLYGLMSAATCAHHSHTQGVKGIEVKLLEKRQEPAILILETPSA